MKGDLKTPVLEAARQYRDEERRSLSRVMSNLGKEPCDHAIMGVTNHAVKNQACWILITERFISYVEDPGQTIPNDLEIIALLDTALESCVRSWPDLASSLIQARIHLRQRVMGLTPLPPKPYTADEVVQLAQHSQDQSLQDATEAAGVVETQDMVEFYEGIAGDYRELQEIAQRGDMKALVNRWRGLDTADRENFGQGHDSWDDDRWSATLLEYGLR